MAIIATDIQCTHKSTLFGTTIYAMACKSTTKQNDFSKKNI